MTDSLLVASLTQADSMIHSSADKNSASETPADFFIPPPQQAPGRPPSYESPAHPPGLDLASHLIEQQSRVLTLLADGLLNKQIADRLSIHERTVKAHVTTIFEKLKVRNRTQAGMLLRSLDLSEMARAS